MVRTSRCSTALRYGAWCRAAVTSRSKALKNISPWQAILDYWVRLVAAFSDKAGVVGRSSETADTYFGEITFRGTNTGDLTMPDGTSIPATGKSFEVSGVETARVRDGKIVEHNMYWDSLGMMRQLGLLPS